MATSLPWNVKGVDPRTRDAARAAARRAGMTLGEWLDTVIREEAADAPPDDASAATRELEALSERLGRLNQSEMDTAAFSGRNKATGEAPTDDGMAQGPHRASRDKTTASGEDRTAAALDSIARWIEKTEQRMSSAERITAERQERATSVVADAIKTIGSRIADIERRTQAEGRTTGRPQGAEPEPTPVMRGGRPVLSREGLSAAVSDIRLRQRDLDGERGVVTELHANRQTSARPNERDDEPRVAAPRFDPERQVAAALARSAQPDNGLAADLLASLRQDLRDLGAKIGAPGRDSQELQDLRNDMSLLRNDVLKLARAGGTGQIEASIRDLAHRLQSSNPHQGIETLMRPLSRIEAEVSRLSDTSSSPAHARIESELSHIAGKIDALASRGSDGRVLAAATRELAAIRDLVADATGGQRLEELAGKLAALSGDIAQVRDNQVKSRDIDTLHASISDMRKQIASQAQPQDGSAMIGLSRQIEALSQRIGTLPTPDNSETEAQLRRIAERLDRPQTMARPADDSAASEALKANQALSSRIESLVIKLEDLAERAPARFENRIESLTEKLERLAPEGAMPHANADSGLERKIEGLAERLDALAAQAATPAGTSRLEKQIEGMAAALEVLSAQNLGPKASLQLERQIEGISARLESLADSNRLSQIASMADGKAPVIDMRPLEDMLRGLSLKLDEAQQPDATAETLAALEKQVGRLAEKLDAAAVARADKGLEQTLQGLVTHFQGLRSETEAAAERVARDTLASEFRKVEERDLTGLARLSDAVEGLQVRHDSTGQQTHHALDAVHETLERIVARLGALERDIARPAIDERRDGIGHGFHDLDERADFGAMTASSRQASEPVGDPTPSSYPAEIERRVTESLWPRASERRSAPTPAPAATGLLDVPLEPGSGRPKVTVPEAPATSPDPATPGPARPAGEPVIPGLGAASGDLRNIIAAARRAAQVVKSEAQSAQMEVAVPGKKARKAGPGLKETLEKRRKPILLGLAAIVLAMGATHVLNSELVSGKTTAPVATPKPAVEAPAFEPLREETHGEPVEGAPRPVSPDAQSLPKDPPVSNRDQTSVLNPALVGPTAGASFARPIDRTVSTDRSSFVPEASNLSQQTAALTDAPEPSAALSGLAPVSGLRDLPPTLGTPGLRKAALAGDARAVYELGVRAADGAGAQRDPKTAIKLFERAAVAGLAPAQFRLGNMFEKGVGAPRDVTLARLWYERAAEKGNAKAMHNLAVLYAEGATGKPDYAMAVEWFRKASEHGMRDSQFNLGVLLARGLGTEQNLTQSWTWFAVGAAQGDEDAAKKRDEVGNKLSPAELAAAKQAVARWKPKNADPSANEVVSPAQGWDEQPGATQKKALKARNV
jgi:localization factor PodJL